MAARCVTLFWSSFFALLSVAVGLQCYTCDGDHWNWGACTTNIKTCAPFQDACTSYTAFHLLLQYDARGVRWHNISKGCDTQQGCERRQNAVDDAVCDRTSYNDWSCVECCIGDLCNYYITLGAGVVKISFALVLTALITTYLITRQ